MPTMTTLRPVDALRAPQRVTRGSGTGIRVRVLLDLEDAQAPVADGVALAGEVMASARRIYTACASDALMTAGHEAARLHELAKAYRESYRRMAAFLEPPDDEGSAA